VKKRARTVEEHAALGRAARTETPRTSHADWIAAPDRTDPVDILLAQGTTRLQELLPYRHGRMAASPFAFYRGSAAVMAADLAPLPRTTLNAQLCGDAHLSNFGGYATPERSMVADLNDFDETHPGPFEWDVKRLAVSFYLAAQSKGVVDAHAYAAESVRAYRARMRALADKSELEVWYDHINVEDLANRLHGTQRGMVEKQITKARSRTQLREMSKLTQIVDGKRRFKMDPPLLVDAGDEWEPLRPLLGKYRSTLRAETRLLLDRYEPVAFAHKVVGVGSVGTRCFVILFVGRDENDPLILQVKEAEASVLEPYTSSSRYTNHGQRVVEGQRIMQASSDIFLGYVKGPLGRSFYFRQLRDWKLSPDPETMRSSGLMRYATLCGVILARAHARSADRIAIASYLGAADTFDNAIANFAVEYAEQVDKDYRGFIDAIDSGRVMAQPLT
jgi:uncharacterized protein (DUF2252 family)